MKRPIFISSGHSNKQGRDRGAISGRFVEGELTVNLRKLIVADLTALGNVPIIDIDNSILSESIAFFKNKTSINSIVLDIHFNAGPPAAKGVETLVPAKPSTFELQLANKLSKGVSEVLDTPMRGTTSGYAGVKTEADSARKSLGWMRLTGETVLLETCFLSNAEEMKKYEERLPELSKKIARILYDASLYGEPTVVIPSTPKTSNDVTYVVKAGDNLSKIANAYGTTVLKITNDNGLKTSVLQIGQKLIIKK